MANEINALINEAAELIAIYDKAAANAYRSNSFHREEIAIAFSNGFKNPSDEIVNLCWNVRNAARLEKKFRALAA